MSMSRKDSKGRVLRKGESQRKNDGRYIYCLLYTSSNPSLNLTAVIKIL